MKRRSFFQLAIGVLAGAFSGAILGAKFALRGWVKHEPNELYCHRLKWNLYERIWLRCWEIENNPPAFINGGVGPLEHCIGREPTPGEREAVASVIQWFGSNCGRCFVEATLEAQGYRSTACTMDKSDRLYGYARRIQDTNNQTGIRDGKSVAGTPFMFEGRGYKA